MPQLAHHGSNPCKLRAFGRATVSPLAAEPNGNLWSCRARVCKRTSDTLISINNMGLLLQNMGRLGEAKPLVEEVLQAGRETLGDRHLDTLVWINNMAILLQDMGQLEEARPLLMSFHGP